MPQQETTHIKILRGTMIDGQPAKKGDIVECSLEDARYLIGIKKAEASDPKPRRGRRPGAQAAQSPAETAED